MKLETTLGVRCSLIAFASHLHFAVWYTAAPATPTPFILHPNYLNRISLFLEKFLNTALISGLLLSQWLMPLRRIR